VRVGTRGATESKGWDTICFRRE